jgi:outer membrane protein assembly factor BamB
MNRRPVNASNVVVALLVCAALGAAAGAGDRWPQFRGPDAAGVSRETKAPAAWSPSENVAWVAEIPGRGWSSPIVWGGAVFLTSAISPGPFKEPTPGIYGNDYIAELRAQGLSDEEVMKRVRARDSEAPEEVPADVRWVLYALDAASGKIVWQAEPHKGKPFGGRHRKNTYASETPATDGERVYVYLGNIGVFAYTVGGALAWSHPLPPQPTYLDFGTASSPVVHDGRVLVLNDNEEDSYLLALDAKTGKEAWRTRRDFGKDLLIRTTFTTPFVWKNRLRTEVVVLSPQSVVSYDLEGKELWRLKGLSLVAAPTPVASESMLVVGSGSPSENVRPLLGIRPGAAGDISLRDGEEKNAYVAWSQVRGGSYITSPLLYRGRVYVLYDQGFLAAYDAETGRELYKARFPGSATFSASPWAHEGTVFCLSEEGETFAVEAGDAFKVVGRSAIGEMSLATPALAHDSLFLRTATKLYRLRAS